MPRPRSLRKSRNNIKIKKKGLIGQRDDGRKREKIKKNFFFL
jgi:hypothetical protein